jgi:hypothetical protein
MVNPSLPIRLSQGHLNLLQVCPPQFQRLYLEQLAPPLSPEQLERLHWGSQFHLLMQQRELGLPLTPLAGELADAQNRLLAQAPEIADLNQGMSRAAEHCRTLSHGDYLLTVIYDLLITYPEEAKIFDWKTYLKPEKTEKLAQNWQTRLYLYVLAATSPYASEQISLTYWFVKDHPRSLIFRYSQQQYEQTEADLGTLLHQLEEYLENYQQYQLDFPHTSQCQQTCPYYSLFRQSGLVWQNLLPWYTNLEEITEVNPFI